MPAVPSPGSADVSDLLGLYFITIWLNIGLDHFFLEGLILR